MKVIHVERGLSHLYLAHNKSRLNMLQLVCIAWESDEIIYLESWNMGMHGVFTSPEKMRIPTEKNTCLTQELANALTIEIRHIYIW